MYQTRRPGPHRKLDTHSSLKNFPSTRVLHLHLHPSKREDILNGPTDLHILQPLWYIASELIEEMCPQLSRVFFVESYIHGLATPKDESPRIMYSSWSKNCNHRRPGAAHLYTAGSQIRRGNAAALVAEDG
ncbi:hypothetical protein J6590_033717 [Homalodisca vitripennis]|nr:hypothetical protein J6590_033717 [Homalodisca vitripennis]